MMMLDEVGNEVLLGDFVKVTALNADRGATLALTQGTGVVCGYGRTRVQIRFSHRTGVDSVGTEMLKVIEARDGRTLRTWEDVHAERSAR